MKSSIRKESTLKWIFLIVVELDAKKGEPMSKPTKGKTTVTKEFSDHNARCAFEAIARIYSEMYDADIKVVSVKKRNSEGAA